MYLRKTQRKNKDGSVVEYYALAHNERHPETGKPVAHIIHSFGRANHLERDHLVRLCNSIARVCGLQVLDPLSNIEDEEIHYQAVRAAGNWEVDAAWSHIAGLATAEDTDKHLLLAAIEAMAIIRPPDSAEILRSLTESDDQDIQDIVDAAFEAMAMTEELSDDDYGSDDNEFL